MILGQQLQNIRYILSIKLQKCKTNCQTFVEFLNSELCESLTVNLVDLALKDDSKLVQNASLPAFAAVHTAETEPLHVCSKSAKPSKT